MINVILIEKIEKLGKVGDVVTVKPGYARNFLLPQKKALRATKDNITTFEKERVQIEANQDELTKKAMILGKEIEGKEVILTRVASESGQLYGSVTARDIANEIQTQIKQDIKRNQVILSNPIKALGIFSQKILIHGDVSVLIELNVAKSAEGAIAQREALEAEAAKEKAKEARKQDKALSADDDAQADDPKADDGETSEASESKEVAVADSQDEATPESDAPESDATESAPAESDAKNIEAAETSESSKADAKS